MAVPLDTEETFLALHPRGAIYPLFHRCMSPPETRPQPVSSSPPGPTYHSKHSERGTQIPRGKTRPPFGCLSDFCCGPRCADATENWPAFELELHLLVFSQLGVLLSSCKVVAVGGTFDVLVFLTYRLPFILAGAVVGTLVGCLRVAKAEILEPLASYCLEMAPLIEEVSDSVIAEPECHRKSQQLRGVFRRCIFFLRSGARLLAKLLNCAVHLDVSVSWKAWLGSVPTGAQNFCCDKDRVYIVPIVLLGDSGIGKSNLIHRLTKKDKPPKTAPTSIVDLFRHRMVIDGAIIEVQVWEVGGHLGFIALGPKFFHSMEGCLLMHDCDGRGAVKSLSSWKRTFEGMAGLRIPHGFPMAVLLPEGRTQHQKVKTKRFETVQDWAMTKCFPAFPMHSMDDIETTEIAMEFLVRRALERRADALRVAKPTKFDTLPVCYSAEQAV